MPLRRLSSALFCSASIGSLLLFARLSAADPCSSPLSPCFDANGLDLALGPSQFASMEDASSQLAPGQLSAALALSYLRNPVVLTAPSPDPEGRRIPLVRSVWQTDVLFSIGILHSLQLGIGLPFRPHQEGAGIEGAQARRGETLSPTAVGDPRIGLGWQVFTGQVSGRARLEVKLPLGDQDAFSGAPGPTWMPSFLISTADSGPWYAAAEVGARLRPAVQLGDVRMGNQLRMALGIGYAVIDQLRVGIEAWALPSLLQQPSSSFGRSRHIPAEWLASVSTPLTEQLWLQAGAGSGLPLSSQGTPWGDDREALFGLTTPDWRALVQVRFTE